MKYHHENIVCIVLRSTKYIEGGEQDWCELLQFSEGRSLFILPSSTASLPPCSKKTPPVSRRQDEMWQAQLQQRKWHTKHTQHMYHTYVSFVHMQRRGRQSARKRSKDESARMTTHLPASKSGNTTYSRDKHKTRNKGAFRSPRASKSSRFDPNTELVQGLH